MGINSIRMHARRPLVAAAVFCAGLSVLGCSNDDEQKPIQTVKHEINRDLDFSTYRTFDIVDPLGETPESDAGASDAGASSVPLDLEDINDEILTEIENQMTDIGLSRDTDAPDLRVSYFANENPSETSVTFYDYFYGIYWGYEFTWTVDVTYDAGTLLIDVVDTVPDPGVLAFRGTAEGVLAKSQDVRLLQTRNAVKAVFDGWPETEKPDK